MSNILINMQTELETLPLNTSSFENELRKINSAVSDPATSVFAALNPTVTQSTSSTRTKVTNTIFSSIQNSVTTTSKTFSSSETTIPADTTVVVITLKPSTSKATSTKSRSKIDNTTSTLKFRPKSIISQTSSISIVDEINTFNSIPTDSPNNFPITNSSGISGINLSKVNSMSTGFTAFIVVLTLVSLLSMLGLIYFFKKRNKSDKLDGSEALNFNLNHHKLGDGSYHPSLTSGFLVNSGAVGYNDRIHNKLKYNNNSTSAPRSEGYSYSESSFGAGSSIVNTPYPYQNYPLGLGYSDDIKKLNVNH